MNRWRWPRLASAYAVKFEISEPEAYGRLIAYRDGEAGLLSPYIRMAFRSRRESLCRFCGTRFVRPPRKPRKTLTQVLDQIPTIQLLAVTLMGEFLSSDVCSDKACRSQLQHECDEFDRARKGE